MPTSDTLPMRRYLYSLLAPDPGSSILDLGCGAGFDLQQMGTLAGPAARLCGLDASTRAIAAAREATRGDRRFSFSVADLTAGIPFGDEQFDRIFSLNLLECIPDKDALLREVHRVLRPAGQVLFAHFDWDSQLVDGEDRTLVRRVVRTYSDWRQDWMAVSDAWMGRRLWRTFQRSGLFEGEIHTFVLTNTEFAPGHYGWEAIRSFRALVRRGLLAAEEYERFHRAIANLAAAGEYFYSITLYIFLGRKRSGGPA